MFKVALKDLLARKRRLVTTSIAIVLGIAFLTGTQLLSSTLSDSIKSLIGDVYEGIDAVVRSPQTQETPFGQPLRSPVPASLVDQVRAGPGVRVADGFVESTGPELVDKKGKVFGGGFGPPTLTYNWVEDPVLRLGTLTKGRGPETDSEMALDFKSAADIGVKIGDKVTLATTQQGTEQFDLVGLVGLGQQGTQSSGAKVMFFTTATAQRLVNQPGQFNYVAVAGDKGVSQDQLAAGLAKDLPDQQVLTGKAFTEENQQSISQFVDILGTFVSVFGYIALFVAIFIIYNTFSIIVQQRTRETALLRAVGARRRQVLAATMLEALLIGLIASVLGLFFGVLLAAALIGLVKNFFTVNSGVPGLTAGVVVLSLVIGVGVTVLSAFIPALRSTKIPPIAALSEVSLDRSGLSLARKIWGGLLVLGGIALMALGLADIGPNALLEVGAGAVALLVSVAVILGPLIAAPASRLLARPFSLGGRERGPQPQAHRRHRGRADHRRHPGGGHRHRRRVDQGHRGHDHQQLRQGGLRGGHLVGHLVRVDPQGHRRQDQGPARRRGGQPRAVLVPAPARRQGPRRCGDDRHHDPVGAVGCLGQRPTG
jgi:putative ABC transport system permease protein